MLWVKHIYMKEKTLNAKPTFRNKTKNKNKRGGGGGGGGWIEEEKINTRDNLSNFKTELHKFSLHPLHCPTLMNTKWNKQKQKTHTKTEQTISLSRQLYIYSHAHPGRHSLSLLAFLCPQPNKPPTKRPKLLVQVLHGSTGRVHHPYRSVLGRDDDSDGAGVALPGLTAGDHQHRVVGLNYTLHSSHAQCVVDATVYVLPPIVHCVYWHPAKKKNGVREGVGGRGRRAEAGGGGGAGMGKGHKQRGGGGGGRVERSGRWRGKGVGGHDRERRRKKREVVLKVKQNTKQKRHNQKKEKKKHRKTVVKKKKNIYIKHRKKNLLKKKKKSKQKTLQRQGKQQQTKKQNKKKKYTKKTKKKTEKEHVQEDKDVNDSWPSQQCGKYHGDGQSK